MGVLRSQQRACDVVAKRHGRRAAGALIGCRDKRGRKGDWDVPFRILSVTTLLLELLEKFEQMSNSGGSWGPDGNSFVTGHDLPEIYRIRFPKAGSVLEVAETIPLDIRGQGIAWDRSEPGVLYGIVRATDEKDEQGLTDRVVVFDSNVHPSPKHDDDDKHHRRRDD